MWSSKIDELLPPLRYSTPLVPLSFHKTIGRNVDYINDTVGVAARADATVHLGYIFTAEPIRPGQTIVVQILATSPLLKMNYGSLAFGLTSCDPATIRPEDLPDIAEELSNLSELFVMGRINANETHAGDELALTLTLDGLVQQSINGSNPVTVRRVTYMVKLWAFVDICGCVKKIRMLSTQVPEILQTTPKISPVSNESVATINSADGTMLNLNLPPHKRARTAGSTELNQIPSEVNIISQPNIPIDQPSCSYQQSRPSTDNQSIVTIEDDDDDVLIVESLYTPRYQNPVAPLKLHKNKGRNIQFVNERNSVVARANDTEAQGYIFTAHPMISGQTIVVQILAMDSLLIGTHDSLIFGLTSCDPDTLNSSDLPVISEDLLDRPEYWVMRTGTTVGLQTGDVLSFTLTDSQVRLSRNGAASFTIMHVDNTVTLWAFMDICGSTTRVGMLSSIPITKSTPTQAQQHQFSSESAKPPSETHKKATLQPSQVNMSRQPSTSIDEPSCSYHHSRSSPDNQFSVTIEESLTPLRYQNPVVPLSLHKTKGKNVQFVNEKNGVAARADGTLNHGYIFTAQPMIPDQTIIVRILAEDSRLASKYVTYLLFGLTSCDPSTLSSSDLPATAEQLVDRPEYWIVEAVASKKLATEDVLAFSLTSNGEVGLSINGSTPETFMHVDHTVTLWGFVDIFGSTTKLGMLSSIPVIQPAPRFSSESASSVSKTHKKLSARQTTSIDQPSCSYQQPVTVEDDDDLRIEELLPPLKYQNDVVPLNLHRIKGRNIQYVNMNGVAVRTDGTVDQGYLFTAQPIHRGQTIVVQILTVDSLLALSFGSLTFGLTSCDPDTLRTSDLPDFASDFLDRPEYWILKRVAPNILLKGTELAFTITQDGQVRLSRNGSTPDTIMYVDQTVTLWAFVNICNPLKMIRMLSNVTV